MPEPLPLGRPDRGEDGAGEPYDADDETEQHPEADEEQERAGDCRQEYSEIEIERFQRLVGDERGFLPLREPDDERRDHVAARREEQAAKGGQVREHRDVALVFARGAVIGRTLSGFVHLPLPAGLGSAFSTIMTRHAQLYRLTGWMYS